MGDLCDLKSEETKFGMDTVLCETEKILKYYWALTDLEKSHINQCMSRLKERYPEKYRVLAYLYLEPELLAINWCERIEITAERMYVSEMTVRRWRKEMVGILSLLLFRVEWLNR